MDVLIILNSSPSPLSLEAIGSKLDSPNGLSSDIEVLEFRRYVMNEGGYVITSDGTNTVDCFLKSGLADSEY